MNDQINKILNTIKKRKWTVLAIIIFILLFFPVTNPNKNTETPVNYKKTSQIETDNPSPQKENEPVFTPSITPEKDLENLIQGESAFQNNMQIFRQKYPWYGSMPIETSEYTVVWDFEVQKFRIRFKDGVDKKDQTILDAALQDIRDIGADASKFYIINP